MKYEEFEMTLMLMGAVVTHTASTSMHHINVFKLKGKVREYWVRVRRPKYTDNVHIYINSNPVSAFPGKEYTRALELINQKLNK
ncbi:MAG: hypothetical protein HRU18_03105 [Pseudoalteromonas sp.]|uniref:hypothetical protein n=1 Tax=Pseudoalteromonas sp. TaxID=53249 RepID=UPI001E1ADAA8|nr:hypothetical protein [Pseudoalteromonas sp.]NRA77173.1 hypothetical protein [Pseudoalteromonas sp.]